MAEELVRTLAERECDAYALVDAADDIAGQLGELADRVGLLTDAVLRAGLRLSHAEARAGQLDARIHELRGRLPDPDYHQRTFPSTTRLAEVLVRHMRRAVSAVGTHDLNRCFRSHVLKMTDYWDALAGDADEGWALPWWSVSDCAELELGVTQPYLKARTCNELMRPGGILWWCRLVEAGIVRDTTWFLVLVKRQAVRKLNLRAIPAENLSQLRDFDGFTVEL